jgi:hypothetical protein
MKLIVSNISVSTPPLPPSAFVRHPLMEVEADIEDFDDIEEVIRLIGEDRLLDNIGDGSIIEYVEQNTKLISDLDISIVLENLDHSYILSELISILGKMRFLTHCHKKLLIRGLGILL